MGNELKHIVKKYDFYDGVSFFNNENHYFESISNISNKIKKLSKKLFEDLPKKNKNKENAGYYEKTPREFNEVTIGFFINVDGIHAYFYNGSTLLTNLIVDESKKLVKNDYIHTHGYMGLGKIIDIYKNYKGEIDVYYNIVENRRWKNLSCETHYINPTRYRKATKEEITEFLEYYGINEENEKRD